MDSIKKEQTQTQTQTEQQLTTTFICCSVADSSLYGPGVYIDAAALGPFPHQIGGHGLADLERQHPAAAHRGLLQYKNHLVLKPLSNNAKGYMEYAFYEYIHKHTQAAAHTMTDGHTEETQQIQTLRSFLAEYRGVVYLSSVGCTPPVAHLLLSELTCGFSCPCIIDMKMGTQTWDEEADQEKRIQEESKYKYQHIVGFRIVGIKIWNPHTNTYNILGKQWGRSLTPEQLLSALHTYLRIDTQQQYGQQVAAALIQRLCLLREWFMGQSMFRFYASSLLLIYEGHEQKAAAAYQQQQQDILTRVGMIDFSHVFGAARQQWHADYQSHQPNTGLQRSLQSPPQPEQQRDTGYLTGLNRLIGLLQKIADLTTPTS